MRCISLTALGFAVLALALGAPSRADYKKGTTVEMDGMKSTAPADWKETKLENTFQKHRFAIKGKEEKDEAAVLILHLGGAGGPAKDNVERWKGFMKPPEGKNIDDVTDVKTEKVGDAEVTIVDVKDGTYKGAPSEKGKLRPDHRLVAVYFLRKESKDGPYFIRFYGPKATVDANKKAFDDFLMGFK